MAAESVSFRITRNAEDLAQTIHALSHRLVRLEQRLAAMELAVEAKSREPEVSAEELSSLNEVERLLQDCRHLLDNGTEPLAAEPYSQDAMAA